MFFEIFTKLCKEHTISPSAVVQAIGLNKSNITYWKRGSVPSSKNLQKIADYFHVTTDYLLTGEEPQKSPEPQPGEYDDDININDLNFALSGEVHELSEDEIQEIINVARFVRKQRKLRDQKKTSDGEKKDG